MDSVGGGGWTGPENSERAGGGVEAANCFCEGWSVGSAEKSALVPDWGRGRSPKPHRQQ